MKKSEKRVGISMGSFFTNLSIAVAIDIAAKTL
jgi:hypothetical protein